MPSFGATGQITTDFGGNNDVGYSVALQSDGKILVGGTSDGNFAIARYNANGTLDTSFGSAGQVTLDFGTNDDSGYGVSVHDGKILIVGKSGGNFAIARYNSNGTLDATFDGDGFVTTDFGGDDSGKSVTVQPNGQILVSGASQGNFAIARYNANGSLDTNFDGDGRVTIGLDGSGSADGIVLQNDGKILVSGASWGGFAIMRYNTDGSLDTNQDADPGIDFDGDGILITNNGDFGGSRGQSITVQTDGKILVSGVRNGDFAIARYNSNGSLDNSFGGDGTITTDFGGNDSGYGLSIQADGKILVSGTSNGNFAIARYNLDGSLDTNFDSDGTVTTDFGDTDLGYNLSIQADGKILVSGTSSGNFAIARYNANGSLDANTPPTSANASVQTAQSAVYPFSASNFSFSDVENDSLQAVQITSLETAGSLFLDNNSNNQEDSGEAVTLNQEIAVGDLSKLKFLADATANSAGATFGFKVKDSFAFSTAAYQMAIAINRPPTINGTPATTVNEDGSYSFTPVASDPDAGATLTFTIQNQPTWASFDRTNGTLSGTPTNQAVGTSSNIVISVSDGVNTAELPAFNLTVNNTNDAPTVAAAIANQTTQAGSAFRFSVPSQTFQDVDAQDSLTLSATQADGSVLPTWLSFDPTTGQFSGTPPQAGSIALKVSATDSANASISDEFDLTIAAASSTNPGTPNPGTTTPGTTTPSTTTPGTTRPGTTTPGTTTPPRMATPNPLSGQTGVLPALIYGEITSRRNGTPKRDRLLGSQGNDSLNGRKRNDFIKGRAGNDILIGGKGNDRLIGGAGNDRLIGGAGRDRLIGGAGNDLLVGGSSSDMLMGGSGSDVFVFSNHAVSRRDRIVGFEASDRIALGGIFAKSNFRGASLLQVIRVEQVGANTEIKLDTDGLGGGTTFKTLASLQNVTASSLTASNFVIG